MHQRGMVLAALGALVLATGCKGKAQQEAKGVDIGAKVLHLGALNDESGPAAGIGAPFAVGKRVLAETVNAGGSGILPEGWKIQLHERDHGYNPQRAVQAYNEIEDDVLFIATSFGTPNTLPLRPLLERDGIVAFSASLSSQIAEHAFTAPVGPSYKLEAMRAMDWAVEQAGGASAVKAGLVYQQDDYGQDGLEGWRTAAGFHKVSIVSEQAIAPGQTDFTAVVSALEDAGATHVLLTTLPSATLPVLGTAAQLGYQPIWIGNTPSWIDRFFEPKIVPAPILASFYWANGLPYWGEDVPGMDAFLRAYKEHGREKHPPDFYVLVSYLQGLAALEAFNRALAAGEPTRAGFKKALATMVGWDAGGMVQPIDLSKFPYETGTRTRILKPVLAERRWEVVAPYDTPKSYPALSTAGK